MMSRYWLHDSNLEEKTSVRIVGMIITHAQDVVSARQRSREIAALLGFSQQEQTRIATAVSEIARNAYAYAGGGRIDFELEGSASPQTLVVRISDRGPGIAALDSVLAGTYVRATGPGRGIPGARRLMDGCVVESAPGQGTQVTLSKRLGAHAAPVDVAAIARLGAASDDGPAASSDIALRELEQQNRELLATLGELRERQEELARMTRELEDTNRGVVALYAELDERADHLRRADEMKSRFLSNVSHELRTPLSSIRALSTLLLDHVDGDLEPEQEKQVGFIRKAAEDLSEMVNDLLDLAKIESGKIALHTARLEIDTLFSALRGMMRPLLPGSDVELIFEPATDLPAMVTDEAKLGQILRNLISNALKFTEAGEVRVSAYLEAGGRHITFTVSDTGIGIHESDLQLIFEEFGQVQHALQNRVKGTGLGLPLCRQLCLLLGGTLTVRSTPGVGSTFRTTLPLRYAEAGLGPETPIVFEPGRRPVLLVEDNPQLRLVYESYLRDTPFQPVPVKNDREAAQLVGLFTPQAIVLDIPDGNDNAWFWLSELKAATATAGTPVIVVSDAAGRRRGAALGADACFTRPFRREELLDALRLLTGDDARSPAGDTPTSEPGLP
jgi:signal transduction histidine kinase/CheY-like chemotaxis protein